MTNPIINNTGDDPATAENGVWRMAIHWKWWKIDAAVRSKRITRAVDDSGSCRKSNVRLDELQTDNATSAAAQCLLQVNRYNLTARTPLVSVQGW